MTQLPPAFSERRKSQLGPTEAAKLCDALEEQPPVSIRLNPGKPLPPPAAAADGGQWTLSEGIETAEPVAWCPQGYYLPKRPLFTFDPLLHAGCYYVQEASSMAISAVGAPIYNMYMERREGGGNFRMLDLCAAPGGKSTLWRSMLPKGDTLLVCNEVVRSRLNILAENMAKWGDADIVLTGAQAAQLGKLAAWFDVVAADVPCSGEGMFRKDHGAREQWSEANVKMCAKRQRQIIADVWPALRSGGLLVYSTCTFNREENEENVLWIAKELGAEMLTLDFPKGCGVEESDAGYRFYPHRVQGEGFFVSLLRKTCDGTQLSKTGKKRRPDFSRTGEPLPKWFNEAIVALPATGDIICAIRPQFQADALRLSQALPTLYCGLPFAEIKGRKLVPTTSLSLSELLLTDAFPQAELNYADALRYLRRESLTLAAETPRGYVLACFRNRPLGLLNNLGSRANNLYPAPWRIISGPRPM